MNKYKLKNCVLEMTTACCYSCQHCGSRAGKARKGELSTEEWLDVADQLAEMGCRKVALIGGEIFLHPGWDILAERLNNHFIRVSIITNGYLINSPMVDRMKACGIDSVAISLEGPETIHDKYRQKGSFVAADRTIDMLRMNEIPVSVITTLNSENVHHLEELYEYLKEKGIAAWQLQACNPMGNAAEGLGWKFDFSKVLDFVDRYRKEALFILGAGHNIGYFTEKEGYLRGNPSGKAVFQGCSAGLDLIGIDSTGNVRGCESLYDDVFIEGNLRERSLYDIWNDPETFKYNRQFHQELLTGTCSTCEHGGICAGGCRSYNYFSNDGNMYESMACAKTNENKENGGKEMIKTEKTVLAGETKEESKDTLELEWVDGELVPVRNGRPQTEERITSAQEPLASL